jgi:hypothetical protein
MYEATIKKEERKQLYNRLMLYTASLPYIEKVTPYYANYAKPHVGGTVQGLYIRFVHGTSYATQYNFLTDIPDSFFRDSDFTGTFRFGKTFEFRKWPATPATRVLRTFCAEATDVWTVLNRYKQFLDIMKGRTVAISNFTNKCNQIPIVDKRGNTYPLTVDSNEQRYERLSKQGPPIDIYNSVSSFFRRERKIRRVTPAEEVPEQYKKVLPLPAWCTNSQVPTIFVEAPKCADKSTAPSVILINQP